MARKKVTYTDLMKMAKSYGVEENAMFRAAAQQYEIQINIIAGIQEVLDSEGSMMITKEYVKGRQNLYTNPLVQQLPKHSDAANKTLSTMLDIINKLGKPEEKESRLSMMMDD